MRTAGAGCARARPCRRRSRFRWREGLAASHGCSAAAGPPGEKEEELPEVDEIATPGEHGLGQAAREGVSTFNRSPYRRAIAGISKSLGDPSSR